MSDLYQVLASVATTVEARSLSEMVERTPLWNATLAGRPFAIEPVHSMRGSIGAAIAPPGYSRILAVWVIVPLRLAGAPEPDARAIPGVHLKLRDATAGRPQPGPYSVPEGAVRDVLDAALATLGAQHELSIDPSGNYLRFRFPVVESSVTASELKHWIEWTLALADGVAEAFVARCHAISQERGGVAASSWVAAHWGENERIQRRRDRNRILIFVAFLSLPLLLAIVAAVLVVVVFSFTGP